MGKIVFDDFNLFFQFRQIRFSTSVAKGCKQHMTSDIRYWNPWWFVDEETFTRSEKKLQMTLDTAILSGPREVRCFFLMTFFFDKLLQSLFWSDRLNRKQEMIERNQPISINKNLFPHHLLVFWSFLFDQTSSRWWFQTFFIFTPIWGRFPIWLIFFKWVETTNQSRKKKDLRIKEYRENFLHQNSRWSWRVPNWWNRRGWGNNLRGPWND